MKLAYPTFVPDTSTPKVNFLENKLLLTPKEAAYVLSVSPSQIYGMLQRGDLPCVRIGRSVRLPRKTVIQLAGGDA